MHGHLERLRAGEAQRRVDQGRIGRHGEDDGQIRRGSLDAFERPDHRIGHDIAAAEVVAQGRIDHAALVRFDQVVIAQAERWERIGGDRKRDVGIHAAVLTVVAVAEDVNRVVAAKAAVVTEILRAGNQGHIGRARGAREEVEPADDAADGARGGEGLLIGHEAFAVIHGGIRDAAAKIAGAHGFDFKALLVEFHDDLETGEEQTALVRQDHRAGEVVADAYRRGGRKTQFRARGQAGVLDLQFVADAIFFELILAEHIAPAVQRERAGELVGMALVERKGAIDIRVAAGRGLRMRDHAHGVGRHAPDALHAAIGIVVRLVGDIAHRLRAAEAGVGERADFQIFGIVLDQDADVGVEESRGLIGEGNVEPERHAGRDGIVRGDEITLVGLGLHDAEIVVLQPVFRIVAGAEQVVAGGVEQARAGARISHAVRGEQFEGGVTNVIGAKAHDGHGAKALVKRHAAVQSKLAARGVHGGRQRVRLRHE